MFWGLFLQILAAILGFWLSVKFVPGVGFNGPIVNFSSFSQFSQSLVFVGIVLGILNYFVKPVLKIITLPLRIITLNLFNLVILMFLVWLTDIFFHQLIIDGIKALFLTTIIIWLIHFIFSKWWPEEINRQPKTL